MNVAVFGTGVVGQMLAAKLSELGHIVTVGTRDPGASLARTEASGAGGMAFSEWSEQHPNVGVATYADAAGPAEVVINATAGESSVAALSAAGSLSGKVLVDVANPLDFSRGMPPSLTVCNTDSLGEQIQRQFPDVKVVKTLNTVTAAIMVAPQAVGNGDHHMFLSGNDAGAKEAVSSLLREMGWTKILDLGDITAARAQEMYLPIWLRVAFGGVGTMFNVKVVS